MRTSFTNFGKIPVLFAPSPIKISIRAKAIMGESMAAVSIFSHLSTYCLPYSKIANGITSGEITIKNATTISEAMYKKTASNMKVKTVHSVIAPTMVSIPPMTFFMSNEP